MVYKIRLKAREKQAECSTVLLLSFLIICLTMLSLNLLPLVCNTALKPFLKSRSAGLSLILSICLIFVISAVYRALSMGCDRFMLKRAEGFVAGAGDIFCYFSPKRFFALLLFSLRQSAVRLLLLSGLSIPAVCCSLIFFRLSFYGFSAAVCLIFGVFSPVFFLFGLISYFHICDTFFIVKYKYIKGDYLNYTQLISASQESMANELKRLRKLKLSFCGWFLLCLLIFPIPYVWCYYRQSKACLAGEIIKL